MREEKLHAIKDKIRDKQYRVTVHALERRIERKISLLEIDTAIASGEIIENYPQDKYGQSCMILGFTNAARPIHVQVSMEPVWIITCYDPSERPDEWSEDFKVRRKKP